MRAINRFFVLALVSAAATLLAGGCMAVNTTTNLLPESDPTLKSPAGQFYVAGLSYGQPESEDNPYTKDALEAYQRKLQPLVRKECVARFPLLFIEESDTAIPIWIDVNETVDPHNGKVLAWMLGTLTIAPGILPAPMVHFDRDIRVAVGVWNGIDGMAGKGPRQGFQRTQRGWCTLLTPLGLIPCPGKSDLPKASEAFNMGLFGYNDVPTVAQQVATVAARLVVTKDTAYWTTRHREPVPSITAQTSEAPTALPPPKANALPF